ncbi:O-antigen ligase-like membrane protein [Humibacillus xanthopallidus]|uniref:O-antigen ligase-like membrane protein n=1 Tax=Humibacillus xanthopallidus TaxID=412689 RepID=A0A543PXK3_9MICO|nr:O-antigen ligase family protein [Humibacillus xanthopallidus]TQN48804.1 O-antigen ligase-like membrane protein [Humibacillus xanthopallidus]
MRWPLHHIGKPVLAGLALLVAWILWAAICAGAGGQPLALTSPYVAAPVGLGVGVAAGSFVATRSSAPVVPLALMTLTGALIVGVMWTDGPAKNPLGYANANAALAVQLIGLSGLALLSQVGKRRILLALSAIGAFAVIVINSSRAGIVVAIPLLVVVAVSAWRPTRRQRVAVIAGMAGLAVSTLAAAVIVSLAARDEWPNWATTAFDSARRSLWHDAWQIWSTHLVFGVGPGNFERLSALGHDSDTAAAHSSVLQVGAETGTVGVVLLGLTVVAGLLWAGRGRPAYAVVGAAAWTALLVHSLVDHLVDFPAIVVAGGMVIGWAGATTRESEELDIPQREGPVAHRRG